MRLPEAQRRTVMGRYYDDLPPRALAARFGVPLSTVKSQIQRGLSGLRRELDETYGDRRSWSVALAPLAMKAQARTAGLGSAWWAWPTAAAAAILVVGAISLSGRIRSNAEPERAAEPEQLVDLRAEAAEPGIELAAVAPEKSARSATVAPEPDSPTVTIRARHRESGLEVRAFEGWLANFVKVQAKLAAAGVEIDALQQIEPHASPLASDGSGEARVTESGALVAYIANETRAGIGLTTAPDDRDSELVVELVEAPPLEIQLVDQAGEPIVDDAMVQFQALMHRSGTGPLNADGYLESAADYDWIDQAVMVHGGKGSIRLAFVPGNAQQPFEAVRAVQTRGFHVAAPGVLALHRSDVAHLDSPLKPELAGKKIVQVTRPALGSLELDLTGAGDAPLAVEGRARMRFDQLPAGLRPESFEAKIMDGVATWPTIAAGGHAVTIDVTVPSLGQSWSVQGKGPGANGDRAMLTTQPPAARALSARIVDADGQAQAERVVHLIHGDAHNRFEEGKTNGDGRVRFTLPEGGLGGGPYLIELFQGRSCVGHRKLQLSKSQASDGGDLGDVAVLQPPSVTIEGTIETPDGRLSTPALVSMTRGGRRRTAAYVEDGQFQLEGRFGEEETLMVHVLLPSERQYTVDLSREPEASLALRPSEVEQPLVLNVIPPAAGTAVYATVDASGLGIHPEEVHLWLKPEGSNAAIDASWDSGSSAYRTGRLLAGTYTAHLSVHGSVPCATWDDVLVRANQETRDPRLQQIPLAGLVRSIDIDWKTPEDPTTGEHRPNMLIRFEPDPSTENSFGRGATLTSSPPFDLTIPRDLPGDIHISAPGFLTSTLRAADVENRLRVDLEPGAQRLIRIVGPPVSGASYSLCRQGADGSLDFFAETVQLPAALAPGSEWETRFPAPGKYRLMRRLTGSDRGWTALLPLIHVEPATAPPFVQELNLAAEPATAEATSK